MSKWGRVFPVHPQDLTVPGRGVELFDPAYDRGEYVALRIHGGDAAKGYRMRTSNPRRYMNDLCGQLAEVAAAILCGLAWPGSWKWSETRADIGLLTEVRSNRWDYGRVGVRAPLVIYPKDLVYKGARAFLLGYPIDEELRLWWFRGWYIADDAAKRDEWETLRGPDPKKRDRCWEVPPEFLQPLPVPEVRELGRRRG